MKYFYKAEEYKGSYKEISCETLQKEMLTLKHDCDVIVLTQIEKDALFFEHQLFEC